MCHFNTNGDQTFVYISFISSCSCNTMESGKQWFHSGKCLVMDVNSVCMYTDMLLPTRCQWLAFAVWILFVGWQQQHVDRLFGCVAHLYRGKMDILLLGYTCLSTRYFSAMCVYNKKDSALRDCHHHAFIVHVGCHVFQYKLIHCCGMYAYIEEKLHIAFLSSFSLGTLANIITIHHWNHKAQKEMSPW